MLLKLLCWALAILLLAHVLVLVQLLSLVCPRGIVIILSHKRPIKIKIVNK